MYLFFWGVQAVSVNTAASNPLFGCPFPRQRSRARVGVRPLPSCQVRALGTALSVTHRGKCGGVWVLSCTRGVTSSALSPPPPADVRRWRVCVTYPLGALKSYVIKRLQFLLWELRGC